VLTTANGVWLEGLDDGETLLLRPPSGYGVLSAKVDEDFASIVGDASIRWTGPATFDETSLRTSFIGNGGTGVPPPDGSSSVPVWLLAIGLVLLAGILVVYVVRQRWPSPDDDEAAPTAGTADGADPAEAPATNSDGGSVDADLLSDEERVKRLLNRNGGRMKQADIVEETDWSNAKVSQLLSAMEEDGEINKLRIGRENLISFPDEDIAELDEQE